MRLNKNTFIGSLHKSTIESPIGKLTIIASDSGIRAVLWPEDLDDPQCLSTIREIKESRNDHIQLAQKQLNQYFKMQRKTFTVPLDPIGTEFQQLAWQSLIAIPFGNTLSYSQQAESLGDPKKARAIGGANGKNPISIIVPCHRVIGKHGSLTGFAGGITTKQYLLELEGAL